MVVVHVQLAPGLRVEPDSFFYAHAPPLVDSSLLRAPPVVSPA
jgi:hypothetical protein